MHPLPFEMMNGLLDMNPFDVGFQVIIFWISQTFQGHLILCMSRGKEVKALLGLFLDCFKGEMNKITGFIELIFCWRISRVFNFVFSYASYFLSFQPILRKLNKNHLYCNLFSGNFSCSLSNPQWIQESKSLQLYTHTQKKINRGAIRNLVSQIISIWTLEQVNRVF